MADVKVRVGSDTSQFQRGLDKARGSVDKLGSSLLAMSAGILTIGSVKGFFDQMDRVGKMATAFGSAPETIQRISQAANIAGTDIESMGKAMFKLNGEIANGSEVGIIALDMLGTSAENFLNLPMDQQLLLIAAEMDKLPTIAEKIDMAYEMFGRRAQNLMPLLIQGHSALAAEMNNTAVVADGTVRSIEKFNDTMTRATGQLKALAGMIIGPVFDGIQNLSHAFGGVIVMSGRMSGAIAQSMEKLKKGDFKGAADVFSNTWTDAMDDIMTAKWQLDKALGEKPKNELSAGAAAEIESRMENLGRKPEQEIDAVEEIAKLEEEAARKRLDLETQIMLLKQRETEMAIDDPQAAVAAAKERIGLEEQLRKQAESEEENRAKSIAFIKESIAKAQFDALTKEEKVAQLRKELAALDSENLQTEEEMLGAQLRMLELEKEIAGLAEKEKEKGTSQAQVFASSLQRVGGGGSFNLMGGKNKTEKIAQDQLKELKQIKEGVKSIGGII